MLAALIPGVKRSKMSQSNYLSEAELEAYQADGFLIRESVYDPQQLEDLRLASE